MIEPTDLDWLALCLVTESNRPKEWPYIAQVIENRRKTGRWGDTYRSVILAPKQFSAFNSYIARDGFEKDAQRAWNGVIREQSPLLLMRAAAFIADVASDVPYYSAEPAASARPRE